MFVVLASGKDRASTPAEAYVISFQRDLNSARSAASSPNEKGYYKFPLIRTAVNGFMTYKRGDTTSWSKKRKIYDIDSRRSARIVARTACSCFFWRKSSTFREPSTASKRPVSWPQRRTPSTTNISCTWTLANGSTRSTIVLFPFRSLRFRFLRPPSFLVDQSRKFSAIDR